MHILQDEEHDKTKMGLEFSIEKARLHRLVKAADKYENRRRENLMRYSLSDGSALSLDNLECAHDVAGFVADNVAAANTPFGAGLGSGFLDALKEVADATVTGGKASASLLHKSIAGGDAVGVYDNKGARRKSINAGRHHGKELEGSLPNRNCPVAFTKPGFKTVRFYEGTYLQYTDPKKRIMDAANPGAASQDHHGTHFTFMKHEKREADQLGASQILNVDPRNLCVLSRERRVPFDFDMAVDEDFADIHDTVQGADDCCGHPIGVKYNNMRLSRRFVDKSFIKADSDIPLFQVGDEVVVYSSRIDKALQPAVVCGTDFQTSAANDPDVEAVHEKQLTRKAQMARKLLELARSSLKKNARYQLRYLASIQSRCKASSVLVRLEDGSEKELPVQWAWLMKPLKYNRTGTFNQHSGIDWLNQISTGDNHNAHHTHHTHHKDKGDEKVEEKEEDTRPFQYKGKIAFGRPSGYGKLEYRNSDMYLGDFQNGLFHGYGTHAIGSKVAGARDYYEGDFYAGRRHGYGVYACNTGDKFRPVFDKKLAALEVQLGCKDDVNCEHKNGSINAKGQESRILLGERPYLYQGEWKDGEIHGYGKKIYIDGSGLIQVGDWILGEPANGYFQQEKDGDGRLAKTEKPALSDLSARGLQDAAPKTSEGAKAEAARVKHNTVVAMSTLRSNRIFKRGELAENTTDCGKCVPTFDDTTHDLLRDRCGNTIFICTCCCACSCTPGGSAIASTKMVEKVRVRFCFCLCLCLCLCLSHTR